MVTNGSGYASASSITSTELGYLSGVTGSIQTQLDGLQPTITGAVTTVLSATLPASVAVTSDSSGKISSSSTTATELGYVHGVTSAIQTQLNGKQASVTGALTSYITSNATASRALVSDASGKLTTSSVTSTELEYISGLTGNVQTQLTAQNIWSASNSNAYYNIGNVGIGVSAPTVPLSVSGVIMGAKLQVSGTGTASAPTFTFNGNSNMGMYAASTDTLAFCTKGVERARFSSNGYMGVGVVPTAPFEVATGASVASMGSSRYFNSGSGSALLTSTNYSSTVSIVSNSSIWVKNGWSFVASSDQRIKKNIAAVDASNIDAIFDGINVYTYEYIDAADAAPNDVVHGFLAQEVRSFFPEAVTTMTECIPSVYAPSTEIRWHDEAHTALRVKMAAAPSLSQGDVIQYYLRHSESPITATVLAVLPEASSFVIGAPSSIDIDINDQIFVYGKMVNDYMTLDKNKLLTVCYAKCKQMADQMASMQSQIDELMTARS
jgi:hypothetical protein